MLPLLATAGLALVLYITGFLVFLTPLPIVMTYCRRGAWTAVMAALAALGVLALLYAVPEHPPGFLPMMVFTPHLKPVLVAGAGLLYFFYFLWLGCVLGWFSKLTAPRVSSSLEYSVGLITVIGLGVPALLLVVLARGADFALISGAREAFHYLLNAMIDLQKKSGISEDDLQFFQSYAHAALDQALRLLPAFWIGTSLVVTGLNLFFLRRWCADRKPFPNWGSFAVWRLDDRWIWGVIGSAAVYLLNVYLMRLEGVGIVSANAIVVLAFVYFFQGLAIAIHFSRRFSPLGRILVYTTFVLMFQFLGFVVVVIGVFDFWFDFRKIKQVAS